MVASMQSCNVRNAYRIAFAVVAASWLALSWPWLSGRLTIPYDAKAHFHAQLQFLANALHTGQSPFWTPNVFGGSPQIADPQSLIFSPAILLALLSPQPSFTLVDGYVLALLGVGQLAIVMLFRDRGWHPIGAVVAAIAFGFGGSAAWRIQHVGQIQSYAFCAVALWLLARTLQRRSVPWGMAAGATAGLMVVEPDQVALLGGYLLVLYALSEMARGGWRWSNLRRYIAPLGAAAVAACLVAGGPLLLTWLFVEQSNRPEIAFAEAVRGSLHPASLLTAVVGDLFGALDPAVEYWGPYSEAWDPNELSLSQNMGQLYLGALPALLVIALGVVKGRIWDREIRTFSVVLGGMLVYALGNFTPVFGALYDALPGVALFRRPADATFLVGLLAALVAGYLAHAQVTSGAVGRATWPVLVVLLVLVGGSLGLAWHQGHLVAASAPALKAVAWLTLAFVALWMLPALAARWTAAGVVLVGVLMSADLSANNGPNESTALPVAQFDVVRPDCRNETIRFIKDRLRSNTDPARRDRVELVGLGFEWPNLGMVHNFDHLLGYNPLRIDVTARAVGLGDTVAGWDQRQFTRLFPSYRSLLADMLGLRYVASPIPIERIDRHLKPGDLKQIARTKDAYIYENPRALPRVMLVPRWRSADFDDLIDTGRWPSFDPRETLLLEGPPDPLPPQAAPRPVPTAPKVAITRFENTVVEIAVDTPRDAFVLMNSAWHPWWRATVDDAPARILKANVMFRAIRVPASSSRVRLTFEPIVGAFDQLAQR
jgi:hypothetical protein